MLSCPADKIYPAALTSVGTPRLTLSLLVTTPVVSNVPVTVFKYKTLPAVSKTTSPDAR